MYYAQLGIRECANQLESELEVQYLSPRITGLRAARIERPF